MHSFDGEPYIRDNSLYVSMHLTKQQNNKITKQQKVPSQQLSENQRVPPDFVTKKPLHL